MGVWGRVSREDVAAAIMRRSAGREGGEIAVRITEPRTRRGARTCLSTRGAYWALPRPRRLVKLIWEEKRSLRSHPCVWPWTTTTDRSLRVTATYTHMPIGECLQETTESGGVTSGQPGYTAKPVAPEFYPGPISLLGFGEE